MLISPFKTNTDKGISDILEGLDDVLVKKFYHGCEGYFLEDGSPLHMYAHVLYIGNTESIKTIYERLREIDPCVYEYNDENIVAHFYDPMFGLLNFGLLVQYKDNGINKEWRRKAQMNGFNADFAMEFLLKGEELFAKENKHIVENENESMYFKDLLDGELFVLYGCEEKGYVVYVKDSSKEKFGYNAIDLTNNKSKASFLDYVSVYPLGYEAKERI